MAAHGIYSTKILRLNKNEIIQHQQENIFEVITTHEDGTKIVINKNSILFFQLHVVQKTDNFYGFSIENEKVGAPCLLTHITHIENKNRLTIANITPLSLFMFFEKGDIIRPHTCGQHIDFAKLIIVQR